MKSRVRVAENRAGGRGLGGWTLGLALLAVVALILASCGQDQGSVGEDGDSAGQAKGVSVADVTDNPGEFYGARITFSGLVTDVVGPNAVAIGGDQFVGGDRVLVVGARKLDRIAEGVPEGVLLKIQQQDLVQASGTLREFKLEEVENEVGYELDDNLFGDWEGEPVLVADSFVLTPQQGDETTQGQQGVNATLSRIVDQPEEFYGQNVTVSGAVAQVIGANAFVLVQKNTKGEGLYDVDAVTLADRGVLVATSDGPNLTERQTVRVTGTLQQFDVSAFEQDLGVRFDGNDQYLSAFSEGPAIKAEKVQRMHGGETTMMGQ